MSSLQSVKPFISSYTWQFMEVYTQKNSSISCIAFSVEEARTELFSTLKKIESMADEKKKADDEIKELYKIQRTLPKEKSEEALRQIYNIECKLKEKFPPVNDYSGGYGMRANDYFLDLNVTYYEKHTNKEITTTLGELILTVEPRIEMTKFITFT
jgi:uncharacterized protein (UPF0335 family)